jgi:pimeloyl-ACP methyl ester carboxylesterase
MASPRHSVGTLATLVPFRLRPGWAPLCSPAAVPDHLEDIAGQPIFWRSAPGAGVPVLYLHGVPNSSDQWQPFLDRTGGLAPDLPGFGRSSKRGDLDYSIEGYVAFLERFLAHVDVERVRLVAHDWGAVGLALAQRAPERVTRIVAINVVPFLPGHRWHPIARAWRARLVGELVMGFAVKPVVRQLSRRFTVAPGPAPREFVDAIYQFLDQGTPRAILRLYRSASPETLADAGARLPLVRAPALVLWGDRDPYVPARFADELARALGNARARHFDDAAHWPWLDRPSVIDEVVEFLDDA